MTNLIHNNLSRRRLARIAVIVLQVAALALLCSAQSGLSPHSGSLSKEEPQAIYHPDPGDSWNRIFYCLFTRTVKTRLSQDFSGGAPTELGQFEISRKLFLSDPRSGGLVALDDKAGSYLPSSGNDYSFASAQFDRAGFTAPVYAALRTRCVSCHGPEIKTIFTFATHAPEPQPPVEQLNRADNRHGNYVAKRKMERDDFKALIREWTARGD